MRKSLVLSLSVLFVAAFIGSAAKSQNDKQRNDDPQNPPAARKHLREFHKDAFKKGLGLTDDQIAKIKEAIRPDREALASLAQKQRDARQALRAVALRDDASEADIRSAATAAGSAAADFAVLRAKVRAKVRPLLTQEQLDKIAAHRKQVDKRAEMVFNRAVERLME